MTDNPASSTVRPMTASDYLTGSPVVQDVTAHPTRDLVVGAVVAALALWGVPKFMDFVTGRFGQDLGLGYDPDDDDEEYDLEFKP